MSRKPLACGLAMFLFALCYTSQAHAEVPSTDRSAIEALAREIGEAFSSGEVDRFLRLLTEDAVWMPPDRPALNGKEAIAEWYRQGQRALDQKLAFAPVDLQIHGDWAILQTTVTGTVAPRAGGTVVHVNNKAFFVLKRQPNGGWLFWRDIWNRNEPVAR